MKKLFTFLLSACVCSVVMAQRPEAVIARAGDVKPTIDGTIDDLWATVEKHDVATPFTGETPTLGDVGTTYWKALFDDLGLYIIVVVNDDVWVPMYVAGATAEYQHDKIELYFDTNSILADGKGAKDKAGNWQIAPSPAEATVNGTEVTAVTNGANVKYAYKLTDPKWNVEYFIPWEAIPDAAGNPFVKGSQMGFDVTIVDRDDVAGTRNRAVWANVGAAGESWGNMDDIGYVTFAGEQVINIDNIVLTAGANITSDNGTSQITTVVTPADHTQGFYYTITEGAGLATIDKDGLVTGLRNGTIKVKASSTDDYTVSNEITLTITGQVITLDEINILKNGNFDKGATGFESWGMTATFGAVEDGWMVMTMTPKTNRWDIALSQGFPVVDATTIYKLKFKAKASADMAIDFIMEDTNNGYPKNAAWTSPDYTGLSDYQLPLTTVAKWYTFDVTFPSLLANSKYSIGYQGGLHEGKFYVDSVALYKAADEALIGTSSKALAANVLKIYPNPVSTQLNVTLASTGGKVAIYNSVGQKMMEKTATSTNVRFDVANLRKGMYFVKFNDGLAQKFVK
jgi:hypothetical protein